MGLTRGGVRRMIQGTIVTWFIDQIEQDSNNFYVSGI